MKKNSTSTCVQEPKKTGSIHILKAKPQPEKTNRGPGGGNSCTPFGVQ